MVLEFKYSVIHIVLEVEIIVSYVTVYGLEYSVMHYVLWVKHNAMRNVLWVKIQLRT